MPLDIGLHFIKIANLIISNSGLNHLKRNDFINLTQLAKLQLYENEIEIIDEDSFYDLKDLEYLDLDRNNIVELSAELLKFSRNLQVFLAAHNKIINISKDFFKTTEKIRKIDLSFNQIENFEFIGNCSHGMENLAFLNLRGNDNCSKFYSNENEILERYQQAEKQIRIRETYEEERDPSSRFAKITSKSCFDIADVINIDCMATDEDLTEEYR